MNVEVDVKLGLPRRAGRGSRACWNVSKMSASQIPMDENSTGTMLLCIYAFKMIVGGRGILHNQSTKNIAHGEDERHRVVFVGGAVAGPPVRHSKHLMRTREPIAVSSIPHHIIIIVRLGRSSRTLCTHLARLEGHAGSGGGDQQGHTQQQHTCTNVITSSLTAQHSTNRVEKRGGPFRYQSRQRD